MEETQNNGIRPFFISNINQLQPPAYKIDKFYSFKNREDYIPLCCVTNVEQKYRSLYSGANNIFMLNSYVEDFKRRNIIKGLLGKDEFYNWITKPENIHLLVLFNDKISSFYLYSKDMFKKDLLDMYDEFINRE